MKYNLKKSETLGAIYDFDIDGGAVGVIPSGIVLPANSLVRFGGYAVGEAFNGQIGASFSIGIVSDPVLLVPSLLVTLLVDHWALSIVTYFDFFSDQDEEIVFQISGAPIDQGRLLMEINFRELQF